MKGSMRAIGPQFNTNRMVREYMDKMYLTAQVRSEALQANEFKKAKELAAWKERVTDSWDDIEVGNVTIEKADKLKVGESVTVRASIGLGDLIPADVFVDIWYGIVNARGDIEQPKIALMRSTGKKDGSGIEYVGTITLETSGRLGHTIRILPRHEDLDNPNHPGLIVWANGQQGG
jgi:starch phosphorylase